jgi:lipoprotein-releasing system ATP-binding protein
LEDSPVQPDLIVSNLYKSYSSGRSDLRVLRDVSLSLSRGESLAITGPSGVGKSTLLQIIGTLDQPTSGSVTLFGEDPFSLDANSQASFRNRQIGFVFQDHHLMPALTAIQNVLLPALATGTSTAEQFTRATQLLESVGLSDRKDHLPGQLSGGEKQRVAIARALLLHPKLLLADEPTGNLDSASAKSITELLLNLQKQETFLLIVVTHSSELAAAMAQRLILT